MKCSQQSLFTEQAKFSCFPGSEPQHTNKFGYSPSRPLGGETVHVRMWLQHSFPHAFKSQCRRCRCGHRGCGHLPATTTTVASQVWWAARIKQMFTNDLTRGSICLQDQCAATHSCAVSWALDVTTVNPTSNLQTRNSVSRCRIPLRCAAPAETICDGQPTSACHGKSMVRLRQSVELSRYSHLHFCRIEAIDTTLSFCYGVVATSLWLVVLNAHRYGGSLGQASDVCFNATDRARAFVLLVLLACIRWAVMVSQRAGG